MTEFNDNFFYALFDPITNNNVFPQYSSDIEFFFEKINYLMTNLMDIKLIKISSKTSYLIILMIQSQIVLI
jgi:hypothetical protein